MILRAALLAPMLLGGCAHSTAAPQPTRDYRAELSLPSVGPVPFHVNELRNHPLIIIFFTTWCMPCLGQLQFLSVIQRDYAARGLRVVAVGMDLDGRKVLGPFAAQSALPYPILVADPSFLRGESAFGPIRELPAVLVLDAEGRAVAGWTGFARPEALREKLDALFER
jgi:thioredoxin-like negative regulator of GroEL